MILSQDCFWHLLISHPIIITNLTNKLCNKEKPARNWHVSTYFATITAQTGCAFGLDFELARDTVTALIVLALIEIAAVTLLIVFDDFVAAISPHLQLHKQNENDFIIIFAFKIGSAAN